MAAFNRQKLDRRRVRGHLQRCDLRTLFLEELGWDRGGADVRVEAGGRAFALEALAHKRGMVAWQCVAGPGEAFPDHPTRMKIERQLTRTAREHLVVYAAPDRGEQCWLWVKREPGRPAQARSHSFGRGQSGEALIQKLEHVAFTLEQEDGLTIGDVTGGTRAAFDVEKVTKRFYERFRGEHRAFLGFIEGFRDAADREWYASLMLNRMMFIYFIQKRGFLDGDNDYLRNRLRRVREERGKDRFQTFYRLFLRKLFHEGLALPENERDPALEKLLGKVPYLNGGLFEEHDLERGNAAIEIPDEAFARVFAFFDAYQWHLDDRPLREDNEINPDVLGHIFEKYINQKQMGAYYTKEDITGYIGRNTIVPFLFDRARKACPVAFAPEGGVWRLLRDAPDRYIYAAARRGMERELPAEIAAGLDDVAQRGGWNEPAAPEYALPTETWREHVARRRRYEQVRARLAAGEVASIDDLITLNLDVEQFARDAIAESEGPELVRAFRQALGKVSILDPTCGSGAFLFAAINILEPLYLACLEAMRGFLDDRERSPRRRRPEYLRDFRKALENVAAHPSERYFILKSIVVENLYGVDIMPEAVEICKLRLFLKLVAQLQSRDQIEPLPDIDFNIRAGNTLVGFSSLEEIREAFATDGSGQRRMLYPEEEAALQRIEEKAKDADDIFRIFREMQTEQGMDAGAFAKSKRDLRKQLAGLREELDRHLAGEYRINPKNKKAYAKWRADHQPFHWFVEFYGVMHGGGFDVVIGNPPYLETREVSYSPKYFECEKSGAIHAMCIECSLVLAQTKGCVSMIVPLSLVSTQRMTTVQHILERNRDCWYSNFSWRPGKLFDGVNRALTIFVSARQHGSRSTYSTSYMKWNSDSRDYLIPGLQYVRCLRNRKVFWVPKFGHELENSILEKFLQCPRTMGDFLGMSKNLIFYRNTGGLYWKLFTDFAPKFYINKTAGKSSRETTFMLKNALHVKPAIAILSSDFFWWWYTVTSNLRDLNPSDWRNFPVPSSAMDNLTVRKCGKELIEDLQANSVMLVRNQRSTGRTETQAFKIQKSKPIIDRIDRLLAEHYGFTDEELDFIINYDIKYRMGL